MIGADQLSDEEHHALVAARGRIREALGPTFFHVEPILDQSGGLAEVHAYDNDSPTARLLAEVSIHADGKPGPVRIAEAAQVTH